MQDVKKRKVELVSWLFYIPFAFSGSLKYENHSENLNFVLASTSPKTNSIYIHCQQNLQDTYVTFTSTDISLLNVSYFLVKYII
jgi:hypothetical protein